jgi:hypothetical protein
MEQIPMAIIPLQPRIGLKSLKKVLVAITTFKIIFGGFYGKYNESRRFKEPPFLKVKNS